MTIPDSKDMMMENHQSISLPCTPQQEKRIVSELTNKAEANKKPGNTYYLISNRWFVEWQKYVGIYLFEEHPTNSQPSVLIKDVNRPGPIDNSDIVAVSDDSVDNDPQLSRTLEEGRHYVLVPQEVWEKLSDWYKGGPALPRKMISVGIHDELVVEVYPLCLKLIDSRDKIESVIRISKKASLNELYERVSALKGIDRNKARIWDYFNNRKDTVLTDSSQTLEESNLQMDQNILLDVHVDGFLSAGAGMDSTGNALALVPMEPYRSSSITIAGGPSLSNGQSTTHSSSSYQGSSFASVSAAMEDGYDALRNLSKGDKGGLAGLQNLGNTCFMNSALQCLVHTPPLMEYFLQDYTDEINKQNPLGMHGELAVAFGELLRKLWSSEQTSVAPRAFKGKLARFAPQFSGYNQHDSQELLAFLLDGLHEDLNRVKQKPYFETKDYDDRPDEEVADEYWRYHKARNDSVVVDVCQGQYKSTLVCPECSKISITFDPFMYLSLPLPSTATRSMTITVFYGDGSCLPMPFTVSVLKQGCCKDLFQALSTACCLGSDETLIFAEVYDHRFYRYLDNPGEPLQSIKDEECIVAYRLANKQLESPRLEICHRYMERSIVDVSRLGERKPFLTPLITHLEGAEIGADIDIAVDRVLSPLRKKAFSSTIMSNGTKENGCASKATEESTSSSLTECGLSNESKGDSEDNEEEMMASRESSSFQLFLTDERGMRCKPIAKNMPVETSQVVRVMLDWTDKEHDLYDASYLKDLPVVHKPGFTAKKIKQEAISLFSCLDAFLKEEPLGPDDMWYCPGCKEHRQATKKLDLWRLPDILVFHLKRFSYTRFLKNKLDTFVNFPIHNLDLNKYVKCKDASARSNVYELYAISNHYGGLGGGHYSAYAKLIDENRWYHFDDSHVTVVSEGDIRTSAAYVLFYQRVKVDEAVVEGDTLA